MTIEKKITQSEKIMHQFANKIISKEWEEGKRLPSERSLAIELGTTRGQVREALRALSLIGLVTIRPSDGTFVSTKEQPIPENSISWIFQRELHNRDDLYHARKLIEADVLKLAFENVTKKDLEQLEMITQNMMAITTDTTSVEEYNTSIETFDLFMGNICGSKIMEQLMQTIVLLRRESSLEILKVPGAIENSTHYRKKIECAFVERDRKKLIYSLNEFYNKSKQYLDTMSKTVRR
ncbi:MAG: FadR/GntR family transcriptional regulator [Breznakia sp.]